MPDSLHDGGCAFVHDPTVAVTPGLNPWLPEVAPSVVLLEAAPVGFGIAQGISGPFVETRDASGRGPTRVLDISDETGTVSVRSSDPQAFERPAILLPLDTMFELRLDIALRIVRRARGQAVKLLPTALRLTPLQRARLIQLLHAFDIRDAGGGPREVAAEVLSSDQARLPSVEWKDSHARRRANRLIHDATVLVERGYLKLLRGG
ncbi:DUF2285 domain-containing protein [Nguyenibacter vanlangensis]|uniref:DUF2285 domain-containing protein n=1 Tax=Nguyenibacter vanlangensis TaxID=1216886 RepID=UPI002938E83D|nr:DUF2285 domain-containing protein [Nguyenibacter vanlangensis]